MTTADRPLRNVLIPVTKNTHAEPTQTTKDQTVLWDFLLGLVIVTIYNCTMESYRERLPLPFQEHYNVDGSMH